MRTVQCFFLLLPIMCACSKIPIDGTSISMLDKDKQIGWLHGNCFAIKNTHLPIHSIVTLILLNEPQTIDKGEIIEKATSGNPCFPLLEDRRKVNIDNGYSFYLIDTKTPINLAIGLVGKSINTQNYAFEYCTTTEGMQFSIKDHERSFWSEYYYLGYESEATCSDESNN